MEMFLIFGPVIDFVLFVITVYGIILRYISKNIRLIDISKKNSQYNPRNLSLVLENKTLRAFWIKRINLVIDSKNKIQFKKYEEPIVLEPLKTKLFRTDPFSYIGSQVIGIEEKTIKDKLDQKNFKVELVLTNGQKIYSNYKELSCWSNWKSKICLRKGYNTIPLVQILNSEQQVVHPDTIYMANIIKECIIYQVRIMKDRKIIINNKYCGKDIIIDVNETAEEITKKVKIIFSIEDENIVVLPIDKEIRSLDPSYDYYDEFIENSGIIKQCIYCFEERVFRCIDDLIKNVISKKTTCKQRIRHSRIYSYFVIWLKRKC